MKDLPPDSTVWVENSCYKKYTNKRKRFGNELVTGCSNTAFRKSTWSKRSQDYRAHCLICEELDFELASKRPDGTANQISTINWIDVATKRCKLHKTLKTFCEGKIDPRSLDVPSKIQYTKCLRAEEAKYHRDCMQCFLSGRSTDETFRKQKTRWKILWTVRNNNPWIICNYTLWCTEMDGSIPKRFKWRSINA